MSETIKCADCDEWTDAEEMYADEDLEGERVFLCGDCANIRDRPLPALSPAVAK